VTKPNHTVNYMVASYLVVQSYSAKGKTTQTVLLPGETK